MSNTTTASKPLTGRTIIITRAEHQSTEFAEMIHQYGGTAVNVPMIEITDPDSWQDCDAAIENIHTYDGIIFTSVNGVRGFMRRVETRFPHTVPVVRAREILVVGPKTRAAALDFGLATPLMPKSHTAEGIVELLVHCNPEGKSYLLPAGNLTRDVLPNELTKHGITVNVVPVYKTSKPRSMDSSHVRQLLKNQRVDVISFFSPSSVDHFLETVDPLLIREIPIAVIGETTHRAVRQYGLTPAIIPKHQTTESLVQAIVQFFTDKQNET